MGHPTMQENDTAKLTPTYGEELCTYLASFNSKLAIKNADNYEMYLETFRNM